MNTARSVFGLLLMIPGLEREGTSLPNKRSVLASPKALENPLNYSQSGSMTPKMVIQRKTQILWIFTHICGREFTQNLVEKFFEISGVDMLAEEK